MNDALRLELIAIGQVDEAVHETVSLPQLSSEPRLAEVHKKSATQVLKIVERHGWPDEHLVGNDGAHAAWMLVYHLIDQPEFQRRMLGCLQKVVTEGRIEAWKVAMIEDRILASEGQSQKYGTRLGWNESGEIGPDPAVEDPAHVDERRIAVGLPPLSQAIARQYQAAEGRTKPTPLEVAERKKLFEKLAREAGWRSED